MAESSLPDNVDGELLLLTMSLINDNESFRKAEKELDDFKAHLNDLSASINVDPSKAIAAVKQFLELWNSLENKALNLSVDLSTASTYGLSPTEMQAVRTNAEGKIAQATGVTSQDFLRHQDEISKSQAQIIKLGSLQDTPWITASQLGNTLGLSSWTGAGLVQKMTTASSLDVQRSLYDELLLTAYKRIEEASARGDIATRDELNRLVNDVLASVPGADRKFYEYSIEQYRAGVSRPVTTFSSASQAEGEATSLADQDKEMATRTAISQSKIDQNKADITRTLNMFKGNVGAGLLKVRETFTDWISTIFRAYEGADLYGLLEKTGLPKEYQSFDIGIGNYLSGDKITKEDKALTASALGMTANGIRSYDASAYHDALVYRAQSIVADEEATPLEKELAIADAAILHSTNYATDATTILKRARTARAKELFASDDASALIEELTQDYIAKGVTPKKAKKQAREDIWQALTEAVALEQTDPSSDFYAGVVENGEGLATYIARQVSLGNLSPEAGAMILQPVLNKLTTGVERNLFGNRFTDAPDVAFTQPVDPATYKAYFAPNAPTQAQVEKVRDGKFTLDVTVNGEKSAELSNADPFAQIDITRPIYNSSK